MSVLYEVPFCMGAKQQKGTLYKIFDIGGCVGVDMSVLFEVPFCMGAKQQKGTL